MASIDIRFAGLLLGCPLAIGGNSRLLAFRPALAAAHRAGSLAGDAHALDTARIGIEHVEFEAGHGLHHLAAHWNAAQRG